MTIGEYDKLGDMLGDINAAPTELEVYTRNGIKAATALCHGAAVRRGWWTDIISGETLIGKRNVPEMLCLIHSEISEAMEGHRKDLMDDKLPHRKMFEVELADALIRIFDLAGAHQLDLGGAVIEKVAYNNVRKDHAIDSRLKEGGKRY